MWRAAMMGFVWMASGARAEAGVPVAPLLTGGANQLEATDHGVALLDGDTGCLVDLHDPDLAACGPGPQAMGVSIDVSIDLNELVDFIKETIHEYGQCLDSVQDAYRECTEHLGLGNLCCALAKKAGEIRCTIDPMMVYGQDAFLDACGGDIQTPTMVEHDLTVSLLVSEAAVVIVDQAGAAWRCTYSGEAVRAPREDDPSSGVVTFDAAGLLGCAPIDLLPG